MEILTFGQKVAKTIDTGVDNRGGLLRQSAALGRSTLVVGATGLGAVGVGVTLFNEGFGNTATGAVIESTGIIEAFGAKSVAKVANAIVTDSVTIYDKSLDLMA